jgi:hypothetical protein
MKLIEGHPEYMLKSIAHVEEKRKHNMSHPVKPMSLKERQEMLSNYHPDYMEGTRRQLRVGVDKG